MILSGVMEPSVKYRSYIRLDLTLLEKPAGDRAWRVVLVGRYPRLSAHPTNNRKQENIRKGDCVEKSAQAIWLNAGTSENPTVLAARQ